MGTMLKVNSYIALKVMQASVVIINRPFSFEKCFHILGFAFFFNSVSNSILPLFLSFITFFLVLNIFRKIYFKILASIKL